MKQSIPQHSEEQLLMWRMVGALGIDLAQAIDQDRLSVERLSAMLKNCARCPEPQTCRLFLEARDDKASAPPSFCMNRVALMALRPH